MLAALVGLLSPLVDNDFRDSVREVVANVLILGGATLDPELEWRACRFRAGANIADGNLDSATADYEAIADIASKCGSPDGDVVAKNGLALVLHLRGNLPAAEARVRELIAIADARCSRAIRVRVRLNLGVVLGKRSRFEEALSELEAALALAETSRHEDEFGDRESIVADIAFTYVQLGNVEAARRIYTALTFSAKTIRIATGARINLMHIAGLRGDSQSVRQLQGELNARPMQTRLQVDYLLTLGVACNAIGDIEQAKIALERCLDLASRTGFGQYLIEADRRIKRISELLSSGDEAKTHRFVDRVVGRAVRALAD
ncbi:MAG TPA: tetratricopeptide repeat protein [Gemmatimonadaceae bacterium]